MRHAMQLRRKAAWWDSHYFSKIGNLVALLVVGWRQKRFQPSQTVRIMAQSVLKKHSSTTCQKH
jgi:hypothetical protein